MKVLHLHDQSLILCPSFQNHLTYLFQNPNWLKMLDHQHVSPLRNKFIQLMRVDKLMRVCMRVFSTLMSWSNENKSCMRVDESYLQPTFAVILWCFYKR